MNTLRGIIKRVIRRHGRVGRVWLKSRVVQSVRLVEVMTGHEVFRSSPAGCAGKL